MKKLLKGLVIVTALAAPALLFAWRYSDQVSGPAWSQSPEQVYLDLLDKALLKGDLTRSVFIDRLKEKAILTGQAPLPVSSFVSLYNLVDKLEREQLDPLFPYFLKAATPEEEKELQSLRGKNP